MILQVNELVKLDNQDLKKKLNEIKRLPDNDFKRVMEIIVQKKQEFIHTQKYESAATLRSIEVILNKKQKVAIK